MAKMKKVTQNEQTFREVYFSIPNETVTTKRKVFIQKIADLTKKSENTVRCWISGVQAPDKLTASILEKELGISASELFPETENTEL